ncbi:MAG: dimethyl sulfoxide reductase anchor subunit [Eggerthellaceae bacterium]|nr:dimethyl sulfoxide reductase anchor subunit [Eggerthellaceae bacterium]
MGIGFENALGEVTLVLFTTLAPSGAIACVIVGLALLAGKPVDAYRRRLNQFLAIPVLVTLVGLVASATHLGNPGNALYVLAGVGRSPLSNEVLAGVVFLGFAGSYWLYSFTEKRRVALERAWVALLVGSGVVFVFAIAFAYQVGTIVTWSHPLVPVNLALNALAGGPLLALVTFAAADAAVVRDAAGLGEADFSGNRPPRAMAVACLAVSGIALVANVAGYAAYGVTALPMHNSVESAASLAPLYAPSVVLFAALGALGVALDALALRNRPLPGLAPSIGASALMLAGIFVMRFTFYMMHLTVGISF